MILSSKGHRESKLIENIYSRSDGNQCSRYLWLYREPCRAMGYKSEKAFHHSAHLMQAVGNMELYLWNFLLLLVSN